MSSLVFSCLRWRLGGSSGSSGASSSFICRLLVRFLPFVPGELSAFDADLPVDLLVWVSGVCVRRPFAFVQPGVLRQAPGCWENATKRAFKYRAVASITRF